MGVIGSVIGRNSGFQLFYQSDNTQGIYADAAARDSYFGANPLELQRLDQNQFLIIKLNDNGSGSVAYQQRAGGNWVDVTSLIQGLTGPPGATGNSFFFASIAERDTFFGTPPNEALLVNGLPIMVNVGDNTISNFIWDGPTIPVTYDNTLWRLSAIEVSSGTLFLGKSGVGISSGSELLNFNEADGNTSYMLGVLYDDTGSYQPNYWKLPAISTIILAANDIDTLPDPQVLSVTNTSDLYVKEYTLTPATSGELRVQTWLGTDETGPSIVDTFIIVNPGDVGNPTIFKAPNNTMILTGQSTYTKFSGIQLKGGLQSTGPFTGQIVPASSLGAWIAERVDIVTGDKGLDKEVLFNDGGEVGTDTGFEYDKSTKILVSDNLKSDNIISQVQPTESKINFSFGNSTIWAQSSVDLRTSNPSGVARFIINNDTVVYGYKENVRIPAPTIIGGTNVPSSTLMVRDNVALTDDTMGLTVHMNQAAGDTVIRYTHKTASTYSTGIDGSDGLYKFSIGVGLGINPAYTINPSAQMTIINDIFLANRLGLAKNYRRGISAEYNLATGDTYGLEQIGSSQSGFGRPETRIFTAGVGSASIGFGNYTNSTNFNYQMSIIRNGNVGIDIGSPTSRLHIYEANSFTDLPAGLTIEQTGSGDAVMHYVTLDAVWTSGIDTSDDAKYKIGLGGSVDTDTRLTLDQDGNVGIGTNNPTNPLHIYENTSNTDTNAGLKIEQAGTGDSLIHHIMTISGFDWVAGVDNSDSQKYKIGTGDDLAINPRLTLDKDNLTGIGIASPVSNLHIYEDNFFVSSDAGLTIEQAGTGDALLHYVISTGNEWTVGIDNSDGDKYKIGLGGNLTGEPRLVIDKNGPVGIGLTTPTSPLHVYENSDNTGLAAGLTIEQQGIGDTVLHYNFAGTNIWSVGIDGSDDSYKICNDASLGNQPRVTITQSGETDITEGPLTVGGVPVQLSIPTYINVSLNAPDALVITAGTPESPSNFTDNFSSNFSYTTGSIVYTGTDTILVKFTGAISMTSDTNNVIIKASLGTNGTQDTKTQIDRKVGTGADVGALPIEGVFQISTNDTMDFFVDVDISSTITVTRANFTVTKIT